MHFVRLDLTNFGPFRDIAVDFPPSGVSVISGPNGSGKTQLMGAAVAAIAGSRALITDPAGEGPSKVALTLGDGATQEVVTLWVEANTSVRGPARCEVTHNETPMSKALRGAFRREVGPRLLLEDGIRQGPLMKREIDAFERAAPESILKDEFWVAMRRTGWLETGVHSAGVGIMIAVVREFMARLDASPLPLVAEDAISQLDARASRFCSELLEWIGQRSQVIVVTPTYADASFGRVLINLPQLSSPVRAMAHFNGSVSIESPRPKKLTPEKAKSFAMGERFPMPENRSCELKEVKGQNPVGSIGQVVDQYVVAFLNAGVDQSGSIYWGVTDSRQVVGVPLTEAQCDEIRRAVVERVGNIKPPLAPTSLSIDFHPVTGDGPTPRYVVEVKVPAVHGTHLYATGSEEVYVKTDAGKKRLGIMQIQEELRRRFATNPGKVGDESEMGTAAAAVAATAAASQLRKPPPRKHDVLLFEELQDVLPFEPTVRLIRDHDFGSSFSRAAVQPLFDFVETWDSPEREFIDGDLQAKLTDLYQAAAKLSEEIVTLAVPIGPKQDRLSVYADAVRERGGSRPKWVIEDGRKLNAAARGFSPLYEEFFRFARQRLNP